MREGTASLWRLPPRPVRLPRMLCGGTQEGWNNAAVCWQRKTGSEKRAMRSVWFFPRWTDTRRRSLAPVTVRPHGNDELLVQPYCPTPGIK